MEDVLNSCRAGKVEIPDQQLLAAGAHDILLSSWMRIPLYIRDIPGTTLRQEARQLVWRTQVDNEQPFPAAVSFKFKIRAVSS